MLWPKPFAISLERLEIGFTPSGFRNRLKQEIQSGDAAKYPGKPALIQRLGRCLFEDHDHRGIGAALNLLHGFIKNEEAFTNVKMNLRRELYETLKLGSFDDPEQGYTQLSSRRTEERERLNQMLSEGDSSNGAAEPYVHVYESPATYPESSLILWPK
ncbi:hypothetical protein [Pseudomonas sp. Pseusp16]|uniref:hypothetical protein n=1 Tax=Pseudomonas sp. Pseusp16 TaxID=3243021 RepID=UPI0039B44A6F